jgi:hypothetical protein
MRIRIDFSRLDPEPWGQKLPTKAAKSEGIFEDKNSTILDIKNRIFLAVKYLIFCQQTPGSGSA